MIKYKHIYLFIIIFGLLSCQNSTSIEKINFDYSKLASIIIISDSKKIINTYYPGSKDPYLEQTLKNPPIFFLNNWLDKNIKHIGTENNFVINIQKASIIKKEIPNIDKNKYNDPNILSFILEFEVEYNIYNDSNFLMASTFVQAKRTTTSSKNISLEQSEQIVEKLVFECLDELASKSHELITLHMKNFIL